MANITNSQYSAVIRASGFLGLFQEGDETNIDPRYALEAENVETAGGMLATAARCTHLLPRLPGPIGTLMRLYRRWHAGEGERDVLIAASGGVLYWMPPGGAAWSAVEMPEEVEAFESDVWSWVTYEINEDNLDAPVDVLLLSNEKDGMICVRGDDMTASLVPTPKKFGVISRYAERIWGGAIPGDPDMLMYSAPFNPFDWAGNVEIPEDGAGDIAQPSWDGDSFTSLTQFGSQLIALKRGRVWRILGMSPGEYAFKEQYGGGARYAGTVATAGERILMLGDEGLLQYDGLTVQPYYQQYARAVFRRMNAGALAGGRACVYKNRYYCSLPLDGSPVNNAVLVLNLVENTWLLRTGMTVSDFLPTDGGLFFTSATTPGRVYQWGERWEAGADVCKWVSPWFDIGRKDSRYGGFLAYLAVEAPGPAELMLTLRTERRARTKRYRVIPPVGGERRARQKRIRFGGYGRRFQFEIASEDGAPWRMPGGIEIWVEKDPE